MKVKLRSYEISSVKIQIASAVQAALAILKSAIINSSLGIIDPQIIDPQMVCYLVLPIARASLSIGPNTF